MKTKLILVICLLFISSSAFADCAYQGSNYPEGSQIGPYVCSGDKWVIK